MGCVKIVIFVLFAGMVAEICSGKNRMYDIKCENVYDIYKHHKKKQ